MRFKCEIDMDNDAFAHDPHEELSKIIEKISNEVDEWACVERTKAIRDSNGNKVGEWEIKGE
jgi:hypothetical protein